MNILLVEPNFPFPNKSKNKANHIHKNFVPIALLKFATLHKSINNKVKLIRGNTAKAHIGFEPDEIYVTSLFTYWSSYVWDCIRHYRDLYPKASILLGGIYATLHADYPAFKGLAKKFDVRVHRGLHNEAEKYLPDYSILPTVDYHATHMMRGCIRNCKFCGTWIIEPTRTNKTKVEIVNELKAVGKNKVIFFDNNILANPNIKDILETLSCLTINNRPIICESQSGFDGRLLKSNPILAALIKKARFRNVRIAWDNGLADWHDIENQIKLLVKAGYSPKDISVFMIYNFVLPYETMLKKVEYCCKWGVQISDCRFRPLDLDYDNYKSSMRFGQPEGSYYIHTKGGWTDRKIREFRSIARTHNIWIRYAKDKGRKYDRRMERWSAIKNTYKFFNLGKTPPMQQIENSDYLQRKIRLLNKTKNYCRSKNIEPPDISFGFSDKLEDFLADNNLV